MFHAYMLFTEDGARAGYGRSPGFDWAYINNTRGRAELAVITPPVPVAYAEAVARELAPWVSTLDAPRRVRPRMASQAAVRSGRRRAGSVLRALGLTGSIFLSSSAVWPSSQLNPGETRNRVPPYELVAQSAQALGGRSLLYEEAMRALAGLSSLDRAEDLLAAICIEGLGILAPAVSISPLGSRVCNRCGSTGPFILASCSHCGRSACAQCPQCRSMGLASECVPLYMISGSASTGWRAGAVAEGASLTLPHALTPAQARAAGMLREWYVSGSGREALVWAVCGAGKTEVSFGTMHAALLAGQKVLFAAPRRDVVAELAPRVRAAFPGAPCSVFHGGDGGQRDFRADITLATTHQAMRFYDRFGLAILDEADAFPFAGSEALAASVDRALARDGRLVIMTATPSPGHLARVRSGELLCIRIPVRHHGITLPVPKVVTTAEDAFLTTLARLCSESVESGAPLIVFVPRRRLAREVALQISSVLPGARVEWVHSQDPARDAKREAIAQARCDVLVSTSVMERGVTVDGVDVIVCNADAEDVFDYRALVQMAGRAGRTTANPRGRVWFLCAHVNWHIRMAGDIVREMNAEAAEHGLLAE